MQNKLFKIGYPVEENTISVQKLNNTTWRITCIINDCINKLAFECSRIELYDLYIILRDEYQEIEDENESYWDELRTFDVDLNDVSSLDELAIRYPNKILFNLYNELKKEFK